MVHFGVSVVVGLGVEVETVADVAGEAGFKEEDDDLLVGVLDGSGEWTAEMVRMVAVVIGRDMSGGGGNDWIWKDLVGRSDLVFQRAILGGIRRVEKKSFVNKLKWVRMWV